MNNFQVAPDYPIDCRVTNVLKAMYAEKFTLRTFLLELFKSDDSDINDIAQRFYGKGGPGMLFKLWLRRFCQKSHTRNLLEAATEEVIKEVQDEIRDFSHDPELRAPHNTVTREAIEKFSLDFIVEQYRRKAPRVFSILNGLATANTETTKDMTTFTGTVGGILLFHVSRRSNYLQRMMGLFLYSTGTPRRVFEVLSKAGLSVSYTSTLEALRSLTSDALKRVSEEVKVNPWILVYDNINIASRKFDQRFGNVDFFQNGATATIIIGTSLGTQFLPGNPYDKLDYDDVVPGKSNSQHLDNVTRFHFVDILKRHSTPYQGYLNSTPEIRLLPVKETKRFPLPSMKIDQSSVEGNKDIINVILQIIKLEAAHFEGGKRVVVAGDQLTISRLRTLKAQRSDERSELNKMSWAIPTMQLFHLQMLLGATILRTHYGTSKTIWSLLNVATLLKKKRVSIDKSNFHAVDELIRETFEAMVVRMWEEVLEAGNLDGPSEGLDQPAKDNLINSKIQLIMERYFSESTREDLNSVSSRNAALFVKDALIYIELAAAIKIGDVGRIEEMLRWITVAFQAGGTRNYAQELLHLHCALHHSWSKEMKDAITSSWLVNTSGKPNRWLPADLYQEHNNLLTKVIHAARCGASWDMLAEMVSTNIETFSLIAKKLSVEFAAPFNSTTHTTVSTNDDIRRILGSLQENNIFSQTAPLIDDEAVPVKNLIDQGCVNLHNGRLDKFIQKNRGSMGDEQPAVNEEQSAMEVDADENGDLDTEMGEADEVDIINDGVSVELEWDEYELYMEQN